jgi:hypothetical protein
VEGKAGSRRWRGQMERYHYPGCRVPFGAPLRNWTRTRQGELLCLLGTSLAWKMQARDAWIRWNEEQPRRNLQWIMNNGRFLMLPWIRVEGPASKILALAARQLPATGKRDMVIARCYWKPSWIQPASAEPATAPPTGSMWDKPPVAVAWTASKRLTAERSRTSTSIRCCATRGNGYVATSCTKQIREILLMFSGRLPYLRQMPHTTLSPFDYTLSPGGKEWRPVRQYTRRVTSVCSHKQCSSLRSLCWLAWLLLF